MADATDQLKLMIEVMNTIINPVNQSLARHSEAVHLAVNLINRLVELYSQEPTRVTIIKEVKAIMDEHDDCCKDRSSVLNNESARRVEEIVRKASEFMDNLIEEHEKQMNETIIKCELDTKNALAEQKALIEVSLSPVGKMKDKLVWLLTALGIGYGVSIAAFIYIHTAIGKLDAVVETLKHAAK